MSLTESYFINVLLESFFVLKFIFGQLFRRISIEQSDNHLLCRYPGRLFISLHNTGADDEDVGIAKLLIDAGVARADDSYLGDSESKTLPG